MREVIINDSRFTTPKELHRGLKEQLNFPEYYGENLSALYDCLTERSEEVLLVLEEREGLEEELQGYLGKVWMVCQDAAEENPQIHLARRTMEMDRD